MRDVFSHRQHGTAKIWAIWVCAGISWIGASFLVTLTPIVHPSLQSSSFIGWILAYPLIGIVTDRSIDHTWDRWAILIIVCFIVQAGLIILWTGVATSGLSIYSRLTFRGEVSV